jgi:hypothetical protein
VASCSGLILAPRLAPGTKQSRRQLLRLGSLLRTPAEVDYVYQNLETIIQMQDRHVGGMSGA